jgi:hypothetical protein
MFAASFLPLYIGFACIASERKRAILGIGLCLTLVVAANSGGAAAGAAASLGCWALWRFRAEMRKIRWGLLALIVLLAVFMKAPIWYIFARVSSITGGDGWHRSYLMDVAYQHLSQWWLAGVPITSTSGWMPYDLAATGGADITNQYLTFGLTAGLGSIVLFILLLVRTYKLIGTTLAAVRMQLLEIRVAEFLFWGFGVTLTVHIINWFGISYFDQVFVVWFMQLACIASLVSSTYTTDIVHENNSTAHESSDVLQMSSKTKLCSNADGISSRIEFQL